MKQMNIPGIYSPASVFTLEGKGGLEGVLMTHGGAGVYCCKNIGQRNANSSSAEVNVPACHIHFKQTASVGFWGLKILQRGDEQQLDNNGSIS